MAIFNPQIIYCYVLDSVMLCLYCFWFLIYQPPKGRAKAPLP
ncbi:hypothetical protein HFN_2172 [Helicobacter fennelliae MRY12-0050]|uniref:Uncharacterized protein n=1 Tax=Helicobacter fennelliae MRY12-0050 TaxID=1325130 RepID=T1CXT3_9HELI|nr:hypothetical protein HFN_2172 [Helicobacter fennelliae MRY12-0050]